MLPLPSILKHLPLVYSVFHRRLYSYEQRYRRALKSADWISVKVGFHPTYAAYSRRAFSAKIQPPASSASASFRKSSSTRRWRA